MNKTNQNEKRYKVGVPIYNPESELYDTKMGVDTNSMPLHYTAHGKTPEQSLERAEKLAQLLTKHLPA